MYGNLSIYNMRIISITQIHEYIVTIFVCLLSWFRMSWAPNENGLLYSGVTAKPEGRGLFCCAQNEYNAFLSHVFSNYFVLCLCLLNILAYYVIT